MGLTEKRTLILQELERSEGVLRLAPAWVPRSFMIPGGRLKLDSRDLYALGTHRGGINERWLSSTTRADNGPHTPLDEGMSYVVITTSAGIQKILLSEAIELNGDKILGEAVMQKYGKWEVLCKFFDNQGPIPHHMHQMDKDAQRVGKVGKPEAYYFPPQLNLRSNNFPYTFFGLNPGTTREDVKNCLAAWNNGDNAILNHSRAYKLQPGTGWRVPAGILHAPGSLVTYEPQKPYDIFGMFQSMVEGRPVSRDLLVKDVPVEYHDDLDYLVDMLDWEENTDPFFAQNHFCKPKLLTEPDIQTSKENAVVYGTSSFSANELTVLPGQSVTLKDDVAYGVIVVQGRGRIGEQVVETPITIRFGELTRDEFFVTVEAAQNGVSVINASDVENLVLLRHFGPIC